MDKLIPFHETGRVKANIYARQLTNEGFDLSFAIPVEKIDDGRFIHLEGHHRAEAFRLAGFNRVPVVYDPNVIRSQEHAFIMSGGMSRVLRRHSGRFGNISRGK